MTRPAVLGVIAFFASIARSQNVSTAPRKPSGLPKLECTGKALCFSGEVTDGGTFRRTINSALEFLMRLPDGIAIVPRQAEGDCRELASVVNPPYRQHRDLLFDASYGWTAEQEVTTSPREFRFVTNCADYRTEFARLLIVLGSTPVTQQKYDQAMAALGTLARGKGRLWVTDYKIGHPVDAHDEHPAKIQWMKFSVEIEFASDTRRRER